MHAARAALKMSLKGKFVAVLIEHGGCSLEKKNRELFFLHEPESCFFRLVSRKEKPEGRRGRRGREKSL